MEHYGKKRRFLSRAVLVVTFVMLLSVFTIGASASSYATYTYSYEGFALQSPDAYVPERSVDSAYIGLDTELSDVRDLEIDDEGNIYIVDASLNAVIVMDNYYKLKFMITEFTNEWGVVDSFNSPAGVFISADYIYVCDTSNNRIVMFDRDGGYYKTIPKPTSSYFEEGNLYRPIACAVDNYGRIFVVSSTTYQGIIVMDDDASFMGFIGAQKVTISAWEIIWRNFQTDEQRESTAEYVSTEFNNITIDEDGFIYVTTSSIDEDTQQSAITSRSTSGDYAPVKKLNSAGNDVMSRTGFWPPSGEVSVSNSSTASITGASTIVDVAVGPEETWSIIDQKRSKVYTYDKWGNMLFIFGDTGDQLGNIAKVAAIVYNGTDILLLDSSRNSFTVYRRTEYGDLLITALQHQNDRIYDLAVEDWTLILQHNSNFDSAYIGIGDALYRDGEYEEAMEYYSLAYDTEGYSDAFREVRSEWMSTWIWVIPIVIIVVCVAISRFFKYANKVNKETQLKVGRKSFKEEMLYAFHLIFHPFDGFWDLKHEQRGSVRAGIVYLIITIFAFFYQSVGTGYIFNPTQSSMSVFACLASVCVPLILFVVGNWCLTTLFDGEGSFKDIFIASTYSLLPLPMMIIPSTLLSNVLVDDEEGVMTLLVALGWVWTGLLLFFGMMVTHDYSLLKNLTTILGTVVAMAFIIFVAVLFSSLVAQMVSFVSSIAVELSYRT
ncbi:MAG: YIP1 family protein [Firmicutes bacterium]|nr:YIP1 family protein [Bacillota bacterium]